MEGWRLENIAWNSAGDGLFAVVARDVPLAVSANLQGHVDVLWRAEDALGIGELAPSPDGRQLALSVEFRESAAWMMEGF